MKPLAKAKAMLQRVIEGKEAVPFKRFTEMGHRPGKIMTGRYPLNACTSILGMLNTIEANAQVQGLNVNELVISMIASNKASTQWHYGRNHRRKMKKCHIDMEVSEMAIKATPKKASESKKETKSDIKEPQTKKEVKEVKKEVTPEAKESPQEPKATEEKKQEAEKK
jgi:ribosomal protein L22